MLECTELACAAHAGLDLIEDYSHVILATDADDIGEVAVGSYGQAFPLNRFDQHGDDLRACLTILADRCLDALCISIGNFEDVLSGTPIRNPLWKPPEVVTESAP